MHGPPEQCGAEIKARLRRSHIPTRRFHVVSEPPFVVVGYEAAEVVQRRSTETVRWAVVRLKRDYFSQDPLRTVTLWLFRDSRSYEDHARLLFGDQPETPFGYYLARHQAVLVNIATGAGTLVHEMVHPFLRANFPACPPWFEEGLASLYEQSTDRAGHIVGLHNWRLPLLQSTVRASQALAVPLLMAMDNDRFFGPASALHYAAARYLCFYLQEQDRLVPFYHEFLRHCSEDPTGWKTFKAIAEVESLSVFQRQWEQFVLNAKEL